MNVEKAIKKLSEFGTVERQGETSCYGMVMTGHDGREYYISFIGNGGAGLEKDIVCEHVRRLSEISDSQSDYFPGSFYPNLTQALRYVQTGSRRKATEL